MSGFHPLISRRRAIALGGGAAASIVIASDGFGQRQLPATPSCGEATLRQTEGPFFKPSSPERQSLLESGLKGRTIEVTGVVLTRGCQPVPRALLDFWQADGQGHYDNRGFRLRGHQFADAEGRFRLQTIIPAQYPGRTPHIHVKVQRANGPVLTTQLYFPDQPGNRGDFLFKPELLMRVEPMGDGLRGRFDFVLEA